VSNDLGFVPRGTKSKNEYKLLAGEGTKIFTPDRPVRGSFGCECVAKLKESLLYSNTISQQMKFLTTQKHSYFKYWIKLILQSNWVKVWHCQGSTTVVFVRHWCGGEILHDTMQNNRFGHFQRTLWNFLNYLSLVSRKK